MAGLAAAMTTSASASAKPAQPHAPAHTSGHKLSLMRFDLNGYVINADYSLGRNTGNTFQQTYKDIMVQGVPIAGQLYITWLDPSTFAIVDVFVMNFKTHTVYDYAPGSASPESAGTITVVKYGPERIP